MTSNPFFTAWTTPFGIPPFAEIAADHFDPAFEAGIGEQRGQIAMIKTNPEAPNFENTVEALELSGEALAQVWHVFGNLTATDTNDALRALEREIYPRLSEEMDAIYLDEELFARVKVVYEQREKLNLDQENARLLELKYRDFVRAGADLDPASREKLKDINSQLSRLTTDFSQNLLKAQSSTFVIVTDEARLGGLPEAVVSAAKQAGDGSGWHFGLDRGTFEDVMTFAEDRELRRDLFEAYRTCAAKENEELILKIVRLRAARARLLGYETHADYQLEPTMAGTRKNARELLELVWRPAIERAKAERAQMEELAGHPIEGHDWWFYAEKLRQKLYAFEDGEMRPYFELGAVRDGAFYVAGKLFGVTFKPLEGAPAWHEGVETYDVQGPKGEHLGVYMMDFFKRASKRGGAWMSTYRDASSAKDVIRPIVTNNMNLTPAKPGEPVLLSFTEVETLFHEFGHGLHGLLTNARYERFSGTGGSPRDYVEFPSQFMEHYAREPEVLAVYAKHYKTGEVIPQDLVDKLNKAATHNQGFGTTEFIAAALLDLHWHELTVEEAEAIKDVRTFEVASLEAHGLIPQIEPRYRSPYFAHLFTSPSGYSAGYYAYLWAEILDADGFTAFKQSGDIFNPALAARLKENIYEAGVRDEPADQYRTFRGQDPEIGPLLKTRGLA